VTVVGTVTSAHPDRPEVLAWRCKAPYLYPGSYTGQRRPPPSPTYPVYCRDEITDQIGHVYAEGSIYRWAVKETRFRRKLGVVQRLAVSKGHKEE